MTLSVHSYDYLSVDSPKKEASRETLFQHVSKSLKHPIKDYFISTSNDIEVCKLGAATSSVYVYIIDSRKITTKIYDCAKEYTEASSEDNKIRYPHTKECEFSVKGIILEVYLFLPLYLTLF